MTTLFTYVNNKDAAGLERVLANIQQEYETAAERDDIIQEVDDQDRTLIHAAVQSGSLKILQLLMPWDIPLDVKDKDGKTALQLAEELYKNNKNEELGKIIALINTRMQWQNKAYGFRFNRVVSMLDGVLEAIAPNKVPPKPADKVLVLGNTGSGKSTLINYLNGVKYKVLRKGLKTEAEAVRGIEIAKISHSSISQTLFPQIIQFPGEQHVYCDLAGFEDNRGEEEQICAASSIHMLSNLPGSIKGILVVLDAPGLDSARGGGFKDTARALAKIIKYDPKLINSVRFVITKDPNPETTTKKAIIEDNIKPMLKPLTAKSKSKAFTEDDRALKFMLEQIVANPNSILIPDVSDDGVTRDLIKKDVANMQANDPSNYNFLAHDDAQQNFNDVLEHLAKWYVFTMNQVEVTSPDYLASLKIREREFTLRIEALTKEIAELEAQVKTQPATTDLGKETSAKNSRITDTETAITKEKENLKTLRDKLKGYEKELASLDTHDMIFVSTRSDSFGHKPNPAVLEHKSIYALDRIQPRYEYYGSNPSYTQTMPPMTGKTGIDPRDGASVSYYVGDQNAREGRYRAEFRSSEGIASYSVDFYTQKRDKFATDIAALKIKIDDTEKEIAASEQSIETLQNEKEVLKQEAAELAKAAVKADGDRKLAAQRTASTLEKRREWLKTAQDNLTACLKSKAETEETIKNLLAQLEVNAELFATVRRITDILDLNSNEDISAFWSRYDADIARKSQTNGMAMLAQYTNRVRVTRVKQPTIETDPKATADNNAKKDGPKFAMG